MRRVLRRGSEALHFLERPVSGRVEVELDWGRRFDHMQQHSGESWWELVRAGGHVVVGDIGSTLGELPGAPPGLLADTWSVPLSPHTMLKCYIHH